MVMQILLQFNCFRLIYSLNVTINFLMLHYILLFHSEAFNSSHKKAINIIMFAFS